MSEYPPARKPSELTPAERAEVAAALLARWPMARRIARGIGAGVPVPRAELEQAALIGLWDALTRRGPTVPDAYCRARVRGAVRDYLRGEDRLPRRARERPGAPVLVSFDELGLTPGALPPADLEPTDERLEALRHERARWRAIGQALARLAPRDASVVLLRLAGLRQSDVGERLGISNVRVSQIESRAHRAIRARVGL